MFLVRTGTSYRCYLNEVESTTGAIIDAGSTTGLLYLGGRRDNSSVRLVGTMDYAGGVQSALDSSERSDMTTFIEALP